MKAISKIGLISLLSIFFAACGASKNMAQKQSNVLTSPPCHLQAGRTMITWQSVYDVRQLKLQKIKGYDSLPAHFTAYKVNISALYGYLKGVDNLPYNKRVISLPAAQGSGCIEFHLNPSNTLSTVLRKKYPNIKSWKGETSKNPNCELRLDFNGKRMQAFIFRGDKEEVITPWPGEDGMTYFLLYRKMDSGYRKIPFKSY